MGEIAPAATSRIRTPTSQSLHVVGARPSNTPTLPSRRTNPLAGAVIVTVTSGEKLKPPVKFSFEAIATRPRPLAWKPPTNCALSLGLIVVLLTESGALPTAVLMATPVAAPVVLVLVTCSSGPLDLAPVSVVVALTLLDCPRLNTAPTPLPANAAVAVSTAAAPTPPANAPLTNVCTRIVQPSLVMRSVPPTLTGIRSGYHRPWTIGWRVRRRRAA